MAAVLVFSHAAGRVPKALTRNLRVPLWNYVFEIHNGRFFKDAIGGLYILIIPLGSALLVLITLSGIYDWVYLKVTPRSPRSASRERSRRNRSDAGIASCRIGC